MIKIDSLSFGYKNKDILKNISLEIPEKSLSVLIGLNGAGKTSLFKCLLKQVNIPHGHIFYNNTDIHDLTLLSLAKIVSFVPQINDVILTDTIVRDYIVEARTPYLKMFSVPNKDDYLLMEKYAEKMGVLHLLDRDLSTLSGGELQLVLITRALAQETPIIIMDEPTSALDLLNQSKILNLIRKLNEEGKTIIFSSHDPNQANYLAASVCLIKDGTSLAYGPAKTLLNKENLQKIYGDAIDSGLIEGNMHIFIK